MAIQLDELQALDIWRRALSASVRLEAPDLSARQMSILLTVYLTTPPHTVRGSVFLREFGELIVSAGRELP